MTRILLAMCAVLAYAGDDQKPKIELPRDVQPIVDMARSGPPEIFADTILRLIERGKIPQREAQIELLEDAFALAPGAVEPIRLIALPATPTDTREMYRSAAGGLALDALSLQSRILKELVTVDREKARELFDHIPRPALNPRPCEDAFIADASAYYEIAAVIAQSAFSPADKEKEAHVQFLVSVLDGAQSPNELAPFARSLQSVSLTPSEWELLLAALEAKLETIAPDYRPFAMSFDALKGQIETLSAMARGNGSDPDALARALRKYEQNQYTADRCGPDIAVAIDPPADWKPGKHTGTLPTPVAYFASGDAQILGATFMRLRSSAHSVADSAGLADFLRDFTAWQPSGTAIDVFHQKATILGGLLQIVPHGDDRDRILNLAFALLESSDAQRSNPAEWMWQVNKIVDAAGADAAKLFAQFHESSSAALAVYARTAR